MTEFISQLFQLALYPFTSGSLFCYVPCILSFLGCCFGLVRHLMRG